MNKLLKRQLREHFGKAYKVPENFSELLNVISGSYDQYEKDRETIERSIDLSSNEMIELKSEIKREKEELKKAHKELKTLFEDINEIFYTIDMVSNKLIQISAACERVYGYTPAEFHSDNDLWHKVIHPEDKHIAAQVVQSLYKGKPVLNEYRIIHKDGSIRWIENKIIPSLDTCGQLVRINGVTSDITGRKQAENELEASFSLLEATIESTADGILVVDSKGKIVRFNKKFVELWFIPKEILDQQDDEKAIAFVLAQLTNPEKFLSKVKELYVNRQDVSFDILKFKDARTIERYSQPQLINEICVGRVWNFRDITERQQAEDKLVITFNELQQALGDISKIMNSSLDVICAVDAKGNFIKVSAASEAVWGYKPEELIGKPLINFVYHEDNEKTQLTADHVMAGNNLGHFENRYIRKDGSLVPIEWSAHWDENDKIRYGVARDVTEKKRLERSFEYERQRLNDLFSRVPTSMGVLKGADHVFEIANPLFLELINKKDIIGKTVKEVLPELIDQGFIKMLDVVYETGETSSANEVLVKLDQSGTGVFIDKYLNFICQVYRNMENKPEGIFFFIIDVTEQVLSRKKIEESELRYRSLVEQATDAICITDASMKFIDINPYGLGMFGYTLEEALQLSVPDILFAEDLAANPIKLSELKLEKTIRNERRLKRKDGTAVDMEVSTKLMEDGRLIMFGHDISERKKAERAIRNSEETRKLIMNSALDAIVGIDTQGYITVWTPQAEKIFGWKEEEVIGKTMSDIIIPHQYRERHKQGFERYLRTGKGVILNKLNELSALNREGNEFPIEISIIPIKQGDTEFFCAFIRDITERKKAEQRLLRSEAKLEIKNKQLQQKNKELEQFAYVASHDMQEPLRTTSSFAELLQEQYKGKLDGNADKYLSFITESSDRMKVLISDLLDYSRIGRKKELAEVNCKIMLDQVLADLGKAINECNAEIKVDDLPVIRGYSTEIKQLFQNLITNAIKFRKENTRPDINISVQKNGNYWQFAVKDNGIGIDEQHKDRIFIIFQRLHTRNEYEGSGIGLAHCKKIVELHGGKIWIESKPGEGTTFHFTIAENKN